MVRDPENEAALGVPLGAVISVPASPCAGCSGSARCSGSACCAGSLAGPGSGSLRGTQCASGRGGVPPSRPASAATSSEPAPGAAPRRSPGRQPPSRGGPRAHRACADRPRAHLPARRSRSSDRRRSSEWRPALRQPQTSRRPQPRRWRRAPRAPRAPPRVPDTRPVGTSGLPCLYLLSCVCLLHLITQVAQPLQGSPPGVGGVRRVGQYVRFVGATSARGTAVLAPRRGARRGTGSAIRRKAI